MLRRQFIQSALATAAAVSGEAAASRRPFFYRALAPATGPRPVMARFPDRFVRFTNADVRTPEAPDLIRAALKGGAIGVGELKYPVQVDGPEMRCVYDIAAESRVPVLIHFEEGGFNSGVDRLPARLKSYPKTIFIGHAQSWWANISADAGDKSGYPAGPVKPGGLTYNCWPIIRISTAICPRIRAANALARDPEFATAFLTRHRSKLMFGSDCPCRDGRGTGQVSTSPALKNRCVARETLTLLQRLAHPDLFRQITWHNGVALLRLSA